MEVNWQPIERVGEGRWKFAAVDNGQRLSWNAVLDAWEQRPEFGRDFSRLLAGLPPTAYRWETPAVTAATLDQAFEFVVVDDPGLDVPPDPSPFAEHLRTSGGKEVIAFTNLGGDATLVVPCASGPKSAYAHLAAFVRQAPPTQQQALWRNVARAMRERVRSQPVWLSTAGGGVAWLHVRLDDRPKYYAHAPYRSRPQP